MCGICGIIQFQSSASASKRKAIVANMNKAILHRGPDADGYYESKEAALAMRRLAIIDQAGGNQPIFNADKSIAIVFNGEIYNFLELRKKLEALGYRLYTQSDTEVLVYLYQEFGTKMLPMLKGMFAFCIHDLKSNRYFLARDAFGEKPLYYHHDQQGFSFSSEVKSLLENTAINRRLNYEALPYYLRTSLVPEPMTLLKNVKSLLPGHYMIVSKSGVETAPYFEASYPDAPSISDEQEAIAYIRPLLNQAVKRQMVSDVPIAAFLSGGIDSSTVVALLQQQSSKPVRTFNVRFEHQAYDESAIARKVAEYYNTDHHEIFVPNLNFEEDLFWMIIDHVGLPFRDSSAIPSYLVTKAIGKQVKVALSGDGGDELFGGYQLFQWYQKILDLKKISRPIRSLSNSGLNLAASVPGIKNLSVVRKLKRGIGTSLQETADIPIALNELFTQQQINKLYTNKIEFDFYKKLKNEPAIASSWSPLRRIMHYRLRHTLPTNMLIKVDRMSMANSLEVRAPFLDPDLFQASTLLVDDLLIREGKGKFLIRQMMRKELPTEVFDHPKTGFNMPLYKFQNDAYKKLAFQLLVDENPMPGLFDQKELHNILQKGFSTTKDNATQSVFQTSHQLWMIMQLFGWAKRFKVQY